MPELSTRKACDQLEEATRAIRRSAGATDRTTAAAEVETASGCRPDRIELLVGDLGEAGESAAAGDRVLAVAVHGDRKDRIGELGAGMVVVQEQLSVRDGVRERRALALGVGVGDVEALAGSGTVGQGVRARLRSPRRVNVMWSGRPHALGLPAFVHQLERLSTSVSS